MDNRKTSVVLVCVTGQKSCEKLIDEGSRIAGVKENVSVLHVASGGKKVLGSADEAEALGYLFRVSSEHASEMNVIRSDDGVGTICDMAVKKGANVIVMGTPGRHHQDKGKAIGAALRALLPDVQVMELMTGED